MKYSFIVLFSCLTFAAQVLARCSIADEQKFKAQIERGRYLIKVTGCNDCHTPAYGPQNGNTALSNWLIGDQVGWKGPWGTTYPINIRQRVMQMTEDQWIKYAKNMRSRPPMPWYAMNAMSVADLRAMYQFIRSLGDSSNQVPAALPPNESPKGPFMDMTVVNPSVQAKTQ